MAIVNRRNALVGWMVVKLGKRVVKQKAASATPSARTGAVAAGAIGAATGAVLFWRHKRSDEGE
jgi:L-aminopeptidase/D-esterase-like protein